MSSYLRRMIALGPSGTIQPGPSNPQDYRYNSNAWGFMDTQTRHIRFWADWPTLQPNPNYMPDDPNNPAYGTWQQLLAQVSQARSDGLYPMVTSYRFPQWANGTQGLVPGSYPEVEYQPEDRVDQTTWNAYLQSGPANARDTSIMRNRKEICQKYPTDLATTGPWGRWIDCLIRNLHRVGAADLEFVNEPNLMIWPQFNPSLSNPFSVDLSSSADPSSLEQWLPAAWVTADKINAGYGYPLWLYGPALADSRGSLTRLRTPYDAAQQYILQGLQWWGWSGNRKCMWSHHNYHDVEHDCGSGSWTGDTVNSATKLRKALVGKWNGWQADGGPGVMITEGGATLRAIQNISAYASKGDALSVQAQLIQRTWNRMYNTGEGAGIGMLAQYLIWTDPNFDCGLCNPFGSSVPGRPAYTTWHNLPVYAP